MSGCDVPECMNIDTLQYINTYFTYIFILNNCQIFEYFSSKHASHYLKNSGSKWL